MKKLLLLLYLLDIGTIRSFAQDYTVRGTVDITHNQEETRKSFESPTGSPDFDFIERQLNKSNAQYQDRGNNAGTNSNPNLFTSSNYSKSIWNSTKNDWDDEPVIYKTMSIYWLSGGFKIEGDPNNTEYYSILHKDTATDNSKFSFIKWMCQDNQKRLYQTSFFLDKSRNLLWFFLRYYDKDGNPYLFYQYMLTN